MKARDRADDLVRHGKLEQICQGDPLGQADGFHLLLSGPPGAGKTTLGLFVAHEMFQKRLSAPASVGRPPVVLILSMIERGEHIERLCRLYDFSFRAPGEPRAHVIPMRLSAQDDPSIDSITAERGITLQAGDVLIVDDVSVIGTQKPQRDKLLTFLEQIRERRLVTILIAEENRPRDDMFVEYAVDGVFHLRARGLDGSRQMEIAKLRWHDFHMGSHGMKLLDRNRPPQMPAVLFYPSIGCLTRNRLAMARDRDGQGRPAGTGLPSGVEGFDEMANSPEPFRLGDQVLLIGPAAAGSAHFGRQFLGGGRSERAIYISFVDRVEEMERAINTLPPSSTAVCHCLSFSPDRLILDETFGAVHNLLAEEVSKSTRLFIDGISTLRSLFTSDEEFNQFLLSFHSLLETFPNVVTLVSYYTKRVFESYAELDVPASERFPMVIGFNFQEQFNRLVRGIVILRSNIADHETSLKVAKFVGGTYVIDPQAGWSRSALLGGTREQVHEERPFIKLFFENRSEESVLAGPFLDFSRRYPPDYVFKLVGKHNPAPTHWSFKGYAGPGHSNTKVVQLRKYVMDGLRLQKVLLEVPPEIIESLRDRFEPGFLWNDFKSTDTDKCVMIPSYADIGVLVYQRDAWNTSGASTIDDKHLPDCWEDVIDLAETFDPGKYGGRRYLFVIPNTTADYRNFVSFFIELCWTYGWDFPTPPVVWDDAETWARLREWVDGPYFEKAARLLLRMVASGKGRAIPNPNEGGHYHEAVFSRRWFSKIHLLPDDAQARADAGKAPPQFGITFLPGIKDGERLLPGISNVDLYALGVIRQALAPETAWMLASVLFEPSVDISRALHKRGVPISRNRFRITEVVNNLGVPPPSPQKRPEFYSNLDSLFHKYVTTLTRIVGLKDAGPKRFKRTADIPRFFELERLLAEKLPRLFDHGGDLTAVKTAIIEGLVRIYDRGTVGTMPSRIEASQGQVGTSLSATDVRHPRR